VPSCCLLLFISAGSAFAQDRVVQVENVKIDYAQVLNVEPVYQTLRATRTEEQCDPEPPAPTPAPAQGSGGGRLTRMLDSVRGLWSRPPEPAARVTPVKQNCRVVEVGREFRRPIAYDVDYVYKGTKFRSRLPEDPGKRLRIRFSVVPYLLSEQDATAH
jgi:hypothetical protein